MYLFANKVGICILWELMGAQRHRVSFTLLLPPQTSLPGCTPPLRGDHLP